MFPVRDLASGACFLALGLFIAFRSVGFKLWGATGPQEGLFPFITGVVMIGLSFTVIGKAVLAAPRRPASRDDRGVEEAAGAGNRLKVVLYAVLIGCYAALLQPVGFLVTTPLFLILVLKALERQSWKMAISVTLGLTALSYLLFAYLLMVPLPKGLLK